MTDRQDVLESVDRFSHAMLTTVTPLGELRSRPMMVAARERNVLWFATHLDTSATEDVRRYESVNAAFQGTLLYLSISGPAEVVDDRKRVVELWKDTWTAWFPDGAHDPDLVLLRLTAVDADIWDLRGTKGLRTALRVITNLVARQFEPDDTRSHVKL